MKNQEYYFNKIKSTSGEISHLANIVQNDIKIPLSQYNEWEMRKSLLIEKLKIILDDTEEYVIENMVGGE